MNFDWPLEKLNLSDARPIQAPLGWRVGWSRRVIHIVRSLLPHFETRKGHMPYLGSKIIDARGAALFMIGSRACRERDERPFLNRRNRKASDNGIRNRSETHVRSPGHGTDRIVDGLLQSVSRSLVLLHTVTEGSLIGDSCGHHQQRHESSRSQVADLFERFIPEEQRVKTLRSDINPGSILH